MMEHRTLKAFEEKLENAISSYAEGNANLDDVLFMADKIICYKHNIGMYPDRLKHNPREKAFHDQWQQENAPVSHVNHGHGILQDLFINETGPFTKKISEVMSQRDRMIVATVIQWLGSNCGMCFLEESLKRFGAKIIYEQTDLSVQSKVGEQ
jgi:hypothetical protein